MALDTHKLSIKILSRKPRAHPSQRKQHPYGAVFCNVKTTSSVGGFNITKRAGFFRLLKVKALSLFVKLRGNFGGKVFVFFLQAFTEFEANVIS